MKILQSIPYYCTLLVNLVFSQPCQSPPPHNYSAPVPIPYVDQVYGSEGSSDCFFNHETDAKPPETYERCENYRAQSKLNSLHKLIVGGLLLNSNRQATVGNDDFAVGTKIKVINFGQSKDTIKVNHGFYLRVFGSDLNLFNQSVWLKAIDDPDHPSVNKIHAGCTNNSFHIKFSIPIQTNWFLSIIFDLGNSLQDFNIQNRPDPFEDAFTPIYNRLMLNNNRNDWMGLKANDNNYIVNSSFKNYCGITLISPPVPPSVGGIGAFLQLSVSGTLNDLLIHKDVASQSLGSGQEKINYTTSNFLKLQPSVEAAIIATIKVWGFAAKKKFRIGNLEGGQTISDQSYTPLTSFAVAYDSTGHNFPPRDPCPTNTSLPSNPDLDQVPGQGIDNPDPDISSQFGIFSNSAKSWGASVTSKIDNKYYFCNSNKSKYISSKDPEFNKYRQYATNPKLAGSNKLKICKDLENYIERNIFLCELDKNKNVIIHSFNESPHPMECSY